MTPGSVYLLPRSRGHIVHFRSITTSQDLISEIFWVSIIILMTAAGLYRTLFRVLQKLVIVQYRAAAIAHRQESFYLFCSVTRVTKVSELFFPDKTNAIKIVKIMRVGALVITHHNITYKNRLIIKSGVKSPSASVTRVTSHESRFGFHQCHYTTSVTYPAIDYYSKSNNLKSLVCMTELKQWLSLQQRDI